MPNPSAPRITTTDAVVIGAGPVGLFQVFQLGLQGLQAHIIDALPHAGGQCTALYGDKPIYDIAALPVCSGRGLVARLQRQIAPFAPQWHLDELVNEVLPLPDGTFQVATTQGTQLLTRAIFIAAGVGAFMPRPLHVAGLEAFISQQVFYDVNDAHGIAGRHIVIHGGGETAIAQALDCAQRPDALRPASVTLQHRREVFDAPTEMLEALEALRQSGQIHIAIGQITGLETQANQLTALNLLTPDGQTQPLAVDVLLVRLGLLPRLGPVADWGLALERKQLQVDTATFATSTPGIYAVGDIITYPGKRKLLVCGFHEATLAAFAAAEQLAGHPLPLEYTSSSTRLQQRLGLPQ